MNREKWPLFKKLKLKIFLKTKTRDEWCNLMEGTECLFLVLFFQYMKHQKHQHNIDRETFVEI